MTLINIISVSITAALAVTGIILLLYYRKKLRDLDGFVGIIKPQNGQNAAEESENKEEQEGK